ncbi:hypothetical protein NM208_g6608 [Fusarium decemcellulare]|uniref:Uncharacterized protein n=1 Tax=Fusarium decemcellulare TaxID=57161 RepID=A0ACC1SCG5_9HYPO|nr:hypothetical protein NM208_g6608 [Fusarium decemcellulare]
MLALLAFWLMGLLAMTDASPLERVARVKRCGNPPLDPQQLQLFSSKIVADTQGHTTRNPFTVPVWFHVLAVSKTNGSLTDKALNDQFRVMNQDYAPHNISFNLQGTTRTINAAWATDQDGGRMRKALHREGYDTLNLYFMVSLDGLGYCSMPEPTEPGSDVWIGDGCAITSSTLPGGQGPYSLGRTVTHEVGHWLGLLHTFEGGCDGAGDFVSDTPAEK